MAPSNRTTDPVAVIGMGYVGMVTAACLARLGRTVIGVESDAARRRTLRAGRAPIREPGLDDLLGRAVADNRLEITGDLPDALARSRSAMICVGTPSDADGACDLSQVRGVIDVLAPALADGGPRAGIMLRSTVPPGTSHALRRELEQASGLSAGRDFAFAFVPEFLREGAAITDFFDPPQTVIGADDAASRAAIARFWAGIDAPVTHMTGTEAEALKYASNAWHAVKISFANEIGRIGREQGFDAGRVMTALTQDTKLNISSAYLKPGFAYGGSCLPKDLRALSGLARGLGVSTPMLDGVEASNSAQITEAVARIARVTGPGDRVALFGLTFKPGTSDLRESAGVAVVRRLVAAGYRVSVVDPLIAPADARDLGAEPAGNAAAALEGSAAALVLHATPETEAALERTEIPIVDYRPGASGTGTQRVSRVA